MKSEKRVNYTLNYVINPPVVTIRIDGNQTFWRAIKNRIMGLEKFTTLASEIIAKAVELELKAQHGVIVNEIDSIMATKEVELENPTLQ